MQFDVHVGKGTVSYYSHLNSVGAKVVEAIRQSSHEVFFSLEVLVINTARFIHDNAEFHFTAWN